MRKRWQDQRNATKAALFAVVEATAILEGTAANLSWAAGQSRAWFVSRDGGKSVAPWTVDSTAAVSCLIALPDGPLLALGEAGASRLPAP